MVSDELPQRLEALVDYLRSRREHHVSLGEIASVTEVLIATMSTYFKAIDTSIYREFRYLSDYINRARDEISQLHPTELKTHQIPRAGRELDAIVAATEEATNTIMEAAETIMAADPADSGAYAKTVNDCVMSIFEACSFQDITGQRISKVVETLSVIEQRLNRLGEVWGVEHEASEEPQEKFGSQEKFGNENEPGMSGPALEGEGIDQDEVDELLSVGEAATARSEEPASPEVAVAEVSEAEEPVAGEAGEWDAPAYADRPETNLSSDDIDRLMGSSGGTGPANDTEPPVPDSRTAEQLVRAVEALLSDDEAGSIDAEMSEVAENEAEDFEEAESYAAKEATNDDLDVLPQPPKSNGTKAKASASSAAASGSKGRSTTQADIDALFS
jgi:chemotaxis regulatin CheY-phosphate phosphatase CheZ